MSMGLATIGLDRFAGLAHWRNLPSGKVVTKPLKIPAAHLAVNMEYVEYSPMRLGITDSSGSAIPGYTLEESRIELDLDRFYSWARWREKSDLSDLVGKDVILHFEVSGGVLYSYRFYPKRAGTRT